jgi:hypothetical protein
LQGVQRLDIGPGDTLYVRSGGRFHVFAPVGQFVRTFALPPPITGLSDMLPLTGGRLLVSQILVGRNQTAGFLPTLRIVDHSGAVLAGYGMADTSCRVTCFSKVFAPSRTETSIVAAWRDLYTIEEWDLVTGRLLKSLSITSSPWFKSGLPPEQLGVTPPPSRINRIARDTGALIWIAATTATSNWEPYDGVPPTVGGGGIISPAGMRDTVFGRYMERRLDRVIEVIDLARNAVLATQRTTDVVGLLKDGFAYTPESDADGYVRFRVWRFAVRAS